MRVHPLVPLGQLATAIESGFACGKSRLVEHGLVHLRPFNIDRNGEVDMTQEYRVPREAAPLSKSSLRAGDILFNNTNSPDLVGKTAVVRENLDAGFSNHVTRIRLDPDRCDPSFVAAHIRRLWLRGHFRDHCTQWVSQAAFGKRLVADLHVPLPPLDEQRRIVDILNRAAKIEELRRRAAERLREFASALFIRMFGDPGENPMHWPRCRIGDVCEVQGGLQVTKKRSVHSTEAPYLRVANVLRDRLVLDDIKLIRLSDRELTRTRLAQGDLLIVEGHGNAAEIGRVAVWDGQIPNCVHQNHIIRARPDPTRVVPAFAAAHLNSSSGRLNLLQRGKTTSGLNTITTSDVKNCGLFLPPLHRQRRYAGMIKAARAVARLGEASTRIGSTLMATLMFKLLEHDASAVRTVREPAVHG